MAAGRMLRSLVSRRRRASEDGEDDEGPVLMDDSESEGSVLSEPEDEDADASSLGDLSTVEQPRPGSAPPRSEAATNDMKRGKKARRPKPPAVQQSKDAVQDPLQSQPGFKAMADTEVMMNGLRVDDRTDAQEAVDFESTGQNGTNSTAAGAGDPRKPVNGQQQEHEDYRKKRDANPAFIPNRGNFFMHDTRGQQNGQVPPMRGGWQGRGRGRGAAIQGGPSMPTRHAPPDEQAAEQPWKHDLHETINEGRRNGPVGYKNFAMPRQQAPASRYPPKPIAQADGGPSRAVPLSTTKLVGRVQIRISLPGMKGPVSFSEVPWKHYTRLPDHRPPLRRDKPVRVSLPGHTQQYVFPSTERSFIFIPRQARPSQHGYHRGSYQRSIGGHGYSSRRTSMYGGSTYSASVAASRRSSMAGVSRETAFSPAGSIAGMPNRPVVRMPPGSQGFSGPNSGPQTPSVPQMYTYPLPQQPTYQGTPTTTTHHPRPQKAISVTGIESPAVLQNTPSGEQQPFQNQLPAHVGEQATHPQGPPPPYFSPRQQYNFPPQHPQQGTPLSGIPEQAIHAPSFQPPNYGQMPFYGSYPSQQNYYYPPQGQEGYPPMQQMHMGAHHQNYMMGAQMHHQQDSRHMPPHPTSQPHQDSASSEQESQQSQSGMVAHESNGMVFYAPASEAQQTDHYQPAEGFVPSYAMPGLPQSGHASEHMPYYYPHMGPQQQQHGGMQEVGSAVYYPAGGQQ